jgi:hypothetical protein
MLRASGTASFNPAYFTAAVWRAADLTRYCTRCPGLLLTEPILPQENGNVKGFFTSGTKMVRKY